MGLIATFSLPEDKVVAVHGSLGTIQCEGCGTFIEPEIFREQVRTNIKDIYDTVGRSGNPVTSNPIPCSACNKALVKPATVLYGRSLPDAFHEAVDSDFSNETSTTVLIVAGTSLTVFPARGTFQGPDATLSSIERG